MDYLIAAGHRVLPVEVKAGASGTLKSLRSFLDSHPNSPLGVRLFGGAASREASILHLPLYAAGTLWSIQ